MAKVVLISWDREGAAVKAERLRAKHSLRTGSPSGMAALRAFLEHPPEAFVIDLDRRPSDGRAIGVLLRQRTATRHVPLVFAGGEREAVARVQALLPDAIFVADWDDACDAVDDARRDQPENPIVRGTMDAYAGAPLLQKLGVRGTVTLLNEPPGWRDHLDGATITSPPADVAILFVRDSAELERDFERAQEAFRGSLWIAWPKRASGAGSDLTQVSVRRYGMDRGLVDYKVAALDDTWSGLRFARRS